MKIQNNSLSDIRQKSGTISISPSIPCGEPIDYWFNPAEITPNNFIHKSLSNWAFNIAVGCSHACRFCYVPEASTVKLSGRLADYQVKDPDAQWGEYVLLRQWDEAKFLASLRRAEETPVHQLKKDGNRAVMYCSTTDPYQAIHHSDPLRRKELQAHAQLLVRRSLELILEHSTLNVRILTRSPLARRDFDLFAKFGKRLMFGMSLPTLRNDLAKIYEPKAPAPSQRLATLKLAKEAGLFVYAAVAPTYPECDDEDLRATLEAIAPLEPVTVFHEPINIRAENVQRIESHAKELGIQLRTSVFATPDDWRRYALESLRSVERIADETGLADKLHLWPDKSLGSKAALAAVEEPLKYQKWLESWWHRRSGWASKAHGFYRPKNGKALGQT
jgi:DNA repair photolyase